AWVEAKMREAAEALRPWFYYKESKVIYCGKDGCEEEPVYLLVEVHTIRGHFRYRYEWVTEYRGGGSVAYERLKDVETVSDGRPYLEAYLAKALELEPGSEDVKLAAEMVFNAGEAFTGRKEWLAWLDRALGGAFAWASAASVPPEFRAFLEEAEARTGIPWWLLAGLIQVESSWNPLAVNDRTGCFGLTQIAPEYWPERARAAGFDPELDRWNPRDQIIAGAVYLAGLFDARSVDWQNEGWRSDPGLLAALARYGGYGTDVSGAQGYIQKVL
ncbi:MAG: transglycosylase SLT domain-containing protein, partial [Firmicutes bacterium]|nr:transglycosylase SLT domain-containing protein [Bacillota bacterium]